MKHTEDRKRDIKNADRSSCLRAWEGLHEMHPERIYLFPAFNNIEVYNSDAELLNERLDIEIAVDNQYNKGTKYCHFTLDEKDELTQELNKADIEYQTMTQNTLGILHSKERNEKYHKEEYAENKAKIEIFKTINVQTYSDDGSDKLGIRDDREDNYEIWKKLKADYKDYLYIMNFPEGYETYMEDAIFLSQLTGIKVYEDALLRSENGEPLLRCTIHWKEDHVFRTLNTLYVDYTTYDYNNAVYYLTGEIIEKKKKSRKKVAKGNTINIDSSSSDDKINTKKIRVKNKTLDYIDIKLTDCEYYEPYSDSIYDNDESFFYYTEDDDLKEKINTCFDFTKEYSREDVKTILPELDEDFQKELRTCMISCGIEVYIRDYDEDGEINISELMMEDINNGLFKPQNSDYGIIEDSADAFCKIYKIGSALNEWFDWEMLKHIPSMTAEEMGKYIKERYVEISDDVIHPDIDYTIKFVTK